MIWRHTVLDLYKYFPCTRRDNGGVEATLTFFAVLEIMVLKRDLTPRVGSHTTLIESRLLKVMMVEDKYQKDICCSPDPCTTGILSFQIIKDFSMATLNDHRHVYIVPYNDDTHACSLRIMHGDLVFSLKTCVWKDLFHEKFHSIFQWKVEVVFRSKHSVICNFRYCNVFHCILNKYRHNNRNTAPKHTSLPLGANLICGVQNQMNGKGKQGFVRCVPFLFNLPLHALKWNCSTNIAYLLP